MKTARKWAAAGLMAVGLAVTGEAAAVAQEKAPMATPDRTNALTVTIGGQARFQMKTKKRIKEAFNENERVAQVVGDGDDPTKLVILGRASGSSRLEVTDIDGVKEVYLILVQRDLEMLRTLIKQTLPEANVTVTPIGESGTNVILSGGVRKDEDKVNLVTLAQSLGLTVVVNTVSVGGGGNVPHVQLDLTLAKVDRSKARSRGANFIINGGSVSVGSLLGGLTGTQGGGAGVGQVVQGGPPGVTPSALQTIPTGTANLIAGFAGSQAQLLISALKTEGLAKLVSAPTVVTRSGDEAEFLVGGQVPVISPAAGINGPGVTYRDVGTQLRFLPIVYGNGKIHMTVSPSVRIVNNAQALTTTFGTSPAFEEQRMTTSVICEPGQTVAIGGLIQTTSQASVVKIPHLGDIPYLGFLFSFATQTEQEVELVILVTPRLIDPADCTQMPRALPGSETRKPDDWEFYLETILEAPRGSRTIWNGTEYVPAWKSGPSADLFPCAGNSPFGGTQSTEPTKAMPSAKMTRPEPAIASKELLMPPAKADERKTAELPQK